MYDGLDDLLSHTAATIQKSLPPNLDLQLNVVYFPQLGFHIALPVHPLTAEPMYCENKSWERMFSTENQVYFKDFRMLEMDEQVGDVYSTICGMRSKSTTNTVISVDSQSRARDRDFIRACSTRSAARKDTG